MSKKISILVTVGGHTDSFMRMVEYILRFSEIYEEYMITIQHGFTKIEEQKKLKYQKIVFIEFLSRSEMLSLIKDSNVIITHAGIGTINDCINFNKKPIIIPRLTQLREHTDPSQVEVCNFFMRNLLGYCLEKLPSFQDLNFIIKQATNLKVSVKKNYVETFKKYLSIDVENI